jgi:hypothetical protein
VYASPELPFTLAYVHVWFRQVAASKLLAPKPARAAGAIVAANATASKTVPSAKRNRLRRLIKGLVPVRPWL